MKRLLGRSIASACALAFAVSVSNCAVLKAAGLPGTSCPDMQNAEAVAAFDWEKGFSLDAKTALAIRKSIPAAVEISGFVKRIDDDLKAACGGFASDLGQKGTYKDAEEACKAAVAALDAERAKVGAKAKLSLHVEPPTCTVSMAPFAACAKSCGHLEASADVSCTGGHVYGQCSGECSGDCSLEAAGSCDGSCTGRCEVAATATCKGSCEGKCEGQDSHGACKGKCEGTCVTDVKAGKCEGKCQGNCKLSAKAKCEGQCGGTCSVDMKAPRCSGSVKMPSLSPECMGECSLVAVLSSDCLKPGVHFSIKGAEDQAAAHRLQAAVEKNLPAVFAIAIGLKDKALGAIVSAKKVVEGGIAVGEEISKAAGGDPKKAATSAALVACIMGPYKDAVEGVAGLKGKIDLSVSLKASFEGKASLGK